MSSKTVAVIILVALVILGIYFYSTNKADKVQVSSEQNSSLSSVGAPEKTSSSDAIVDYVVDDLSADEQATAQASVDKSAPSQAEAGNSLNTNF
ncbi:hypothetical protein EPO17_03050 [Patescibacteria group bacterium]|nr:MAG: hypothetical protein EPO17_03050 [Patescibacteria group bacterium]